MTSCKLKLEAPWDEVKEMLKEINADITDEDLEYEPGQETLLLERLSVKLHRDVPAVKAWIESVSFNRGIAS
ncbi:MAG: CsbD family protein [Flavisolibacter sp.]